MKQRLVLATHNRGKIEEIKAFLHDLPLDFLSLDDFPIISEVTEDQPDFAGNAGKKAGAIARATGEMALADDSGLEVIALGRRPGVRSARFAGPGAGDETNNRLLLSLLKGVPPAERAAVFRCAMALAYPDGEMHLVEGSCHGQIAVEPRGNGGFGYDPLFIYTPLGLTFAEIEPGIKSKFSHRGQALRRVRRLLQDLLHEKEHAGNERIENEEPRKSGSNWTLRPAGR